MVLFGRKGKEGKEERRGGEEKENKGKKNEMLWTDCNINEEKMKP